MREKRLGFRSRSIHSGEPRPGIRGAVTLPIFQSSTYDYRGESDYNSIRYIRLNNSPNHICLGEKIADLENAEAGLVTGSGMAAITTALLHIVGHEEALLAQNNLYGGTHHFLTHEFGKLGRRVVFFDPHSEEWPGGSELKAVYVETTSNPLLRVPDLPSIAKKARDRGLVSVIDNTFPSPVNCNPIDYGFDLVLHSATKYLNGHTDVAAGCVAGRRDLVAGITKFLNHLGGCLDPHACFLLNRGIKTLEIRVRQQNLTAMTLANWLEKRVEKVLYPGLSGHPDHLMASRILRGFGAIVSFEFPGTPNETDAFMRRLRLPYIAPSLGGVETLITRPATTSHSGVSPDSRRKMGLSDTLVRVSVGLEDEADLIADFEQALG